MGRRHLSCNEPRAPQPRCTGCVLTDEAGTWRGALEWRETVRYYYRCASEAAGAYIASILPTNTTVSYKNILFRTVLIKLHCDDRHDDTRGQCSNFVDGENFDGMIPDRSGDFDDQSIDFDPVCAEPIKLG